jgi:DNA-binding MurR/RpiR family transcriptional regulator
VGVLNQSSESRPEHSGEQGGAQGPGQSPERSVAESLRRADGFAPAERRVVRALLADYPLTGLEPLAVVAERAGTSAPTVLRVVGKLGFSGYPPFQRALRAELAARWTAPVDVIHELPERGRVASVRDAVRAWVTHDLDRLCAEQDLAAATALLADERRPVWAVGGRFSRVLADYLALQLRLLRRGVHVVPGDPGDRHAALLDVVRRDVVVAFDYRRYQQDTIEFGTRAVDHGARLVLFTDRYLSPLAGVAHVVLTTTAETRSPFAVLSPAMAAVDVVLVGVVDRLGDAPRPRLTRFDALSGEVLSGPGAVPAAPAENVVGPELPGGPS